MAITLAIILGIAYTYLEFQLPNVGVLKDAHMQVPLRIYSSDGQLIAQYGSLRRTPVSLQQIPPQLIKAVLATEDARYYEHPGVDFIGLIRATVAVISTGKKVQGASTITMQVARNFFLTRKKTYSRKIKEILLALKIDKELSKDKVLELYLNKVYFGKRAYGVAAASQVYYGKPLNQLTLPQMAMIAGLPQAPSRNNPINNPTQALKRRNHVLWRMHHVKFISEQEYKQAIKAPITASFHGRRVQVHAPYFAEMVRQVIVSDFGEGAYTAGLSVYTTLSPTLQQDSENSLQRGLLAYTKRHGYRRPTTNYGDPATANLHNWQNQLAALGNPAHLIPAAVIEDDDETMKVMIADGDIITIPWMGLWWARPQLKDGYIGTLPKYASQIARPGDQIWITQNIDGQWSLTQLPKVQGAIISMDPQNGAILALSGGFDYDFSNFNRATQAQRQPGSGFKPFIYSAALNKGYTLASVINDAPIVLQDSGENSLWRPHNDTNKFYGPTRLKVGLAKSRNLVSIRLLRAIGIDYTLGYVKRFGFDPRLLPHTLSLALGSGTVTPLQMASGYAIFANGGYQVTPFFINKVIDENGKAIYKQQAKIACTNCFTGDKPANIAPQVLTSQNAYLMYDAMQSVITQGTGRAALTLKRTDLAGKTGTTNDQVDAWFTGFNSQLLTSVWVGFDNLTPVKEYGARAALPIWIHFMKNALHGVPEMAMSEPPGIVTARIDSKNGLLAPPKDKNVIFEQFRQKYAPSTYAQVASRTPVTNSPSTSTTSSSPDDSGPIF
jgi:penicillin-binding protein 1A